MSAPARTRGLAAPEGYRAHQRDCGSSVYLVWRVRAAPQPDVLLGHVQRERHRGNLWTSWPKDGAVSHHQTGATAVAWLCALDAASVTREVAR